MMRFAVIALLAAGASAAAQGFSLPPAERIELDNGVVLILVEKHDVPLIAVEAMLAGGAAADPDGKAGVAALFAALLTKGAGDRDAATFAETVDAVGGVLAAAAEREHVSVSGEFLARDQALMVELLADMLLEPALDAGEFDKLRERSINLLKAAKDSSPGSLLPDYAHATLFPTHPYGKPVDGSEASLGGLTHADVLDYYDNRVGGDRLVVAVSGDFDAEELGPRLAEVFGDWRPAGAEFAPPAAEESLAGRRVLLVDKPGATQTWFWIGNVGVARDDERRAAIDLVNTIFGGSFTSRLNTALRVDSGLTYGVRSILVRPSAPGSISIQSFTRPEATGEAIDMALDVLATFREQGVTDAALDSARNYVLGQFPTRLETAAQVARQFAALETAGLSREFIDAYDEQLAAVDAERANAVIDALYPAPENLLFVIAGDAERIRNAVTKYGPVTEMSITEPRFRPPPESEED